MVRVRTTPADDVNVHPFYAAGELLGVALEEGGAQHEEDAEVVFGEYALVGDRPQHKNHYGEQYAGKGEGTGGEEQP